MANMRMGVLLFWCNDNPRVTSFTKEWAEQALQVTAQYIHDQSAGRQTISANVFEWFELDMTANEWIALSSQGIAPVLEVVEPEMGEKGLRERYDHILVGIDVPMASGGTTPGDVTFLAAQEFSPSYIAHELGHRFGADDAYGDSPNGPVVYINQFCVMGANGVPETFTVQELDNQPAPPGRPPAWLAQAGPGMAAPTLLATGWCNEKQHGVALDLSDSNLFGGGRTEDLGALVGAPGTKMQGPPLIIRYQDLLIEYRVASPTGWDRGLPDPGPGGQGHLVVHRSPVEGPIRATFLDSVVAAPGARLMFGTDNPLDLESPGPLTISVLSATASAVRLVLSRRPGRMLSPQGQIYGGVDVGGGGLVWTPGGGLHVVPPHSPLLPVLTQLSRVYDLQDLAVLATSEELEPITDLIAQQLSGLQESIVALPTVSSPAPLDDALLQLEQLNAARENVDSQNPTEAAEFNELSRQVIEAVQEKIANVARMQRLK